MKTTDTFPKTASRYIAVTVALLLVAQSLSSQDWYDAGWQYRVPISITNAGGSLTDFQVQVTLDGSFAWGHTLAGGADLRFTSDDGETPVDFWIESWNSGTSASIWVKVPSVAASPAATTIYMYYSNSNATTASDGFSTFEFFDDFEEDGLTVPNPARWTASGGTWSIVTDTQHDGTTGKVARGQIPINQKHLLQSDYSGTDYVVESWGRQIAGRVWGLGVRSTSSLTTYTLNLYEDLNATNNIYYYRWLSGQSTISPWNGAVGVINPNVWYKLKVKAHGSSFDIYFNDNLLTTASNSDLPSGAVGLFGEYDPSPQTAGDYQYNDIRVRKYAASEPTSGVGSEEAYPYPPLTVTLDSKTDLLCYGDSDGEIYISVSGGTAPYTYEWTGPGGYTSDDEDITGLIAGDYSLFVSASNGSVGSLNTTITQPPAVSVSHVVISPYDCLTGTATVEITATGGTPPYVGTGEFTQSVGTTYYTVTDGNGCTGGVSVMVNADGSWLDPDWLYRKSVEVTNSTGATLSDFQVQVSLDGTFDFGKTNDDGSDIRVTASDGTTQLPYWIEEWDEAGTEAIIWVKVPSIPVTGTNIYLYYGNSSATDESNGDNTFEFFDDFSTSVTQQEGYYEFGPAIANIIPRTWESTVAHTLSVVRAPDGAAYDYYGYYGPQGSGYVALAGSDDLINWTKFPYNQDPLAGTVNPIAMGGGERWPSVYLNETDGVYYMVHTMGYNATSYLVYRTSTDGLTWSAPTTIIQDGVRNQNPSLFYDTGTGDYYLYWYRGQSGWSIMARQAATVAGLVSATNQTLIVSSTTLAAPQVLYYDDTYFLSTEINPGGIWQVRMYSGPTPTGPFTVLPGNPVLDDGCACLFQHLFNGSIYEYYCKETSGTWTLDMRVVDPATGRILYEQGELDGSKWTADGGTWTVQSATQPDGTTGLVAQGITTANQILKSSFSGSDFILEGYGRQLADRVWGLGTRVTDRQNLYSLNLYENLDNDPLHNLHFYTWYNGGVTQDVYDDLGIIDLNTWYKLKIAAHGSSFDLYFNDTYRTTSSDATFSSGSVALYGENGTTAQYDDIRVRKYAENEPSATPGDEESPGQWTGTVDTDWNNPSNWSDGVPGPCSVIAISGSPSNQPVITSTATQQVFSLMIPEGSSLTIDPGASLTVDGDLISNGGLMIKSAAYVEPAGLTSSGSLIVRGSSSGTVTFNRFLRPDAITGDLHLFSSPVGSLDIPDFLTTYDAKIDFLRVWDEEAAVWAEVTTGNFESGKGYNVYQATGSDGDFSFTGSVVSSATVIATSPYAEPYDLRNGTDPYGVEGDHSSVTWASGRSWDNYGGGGWNLLGNPFTSAMDASIFISTNLSSFDPYYQALYVYDGIGGIYKYSAVSIPGYPEGADSHGSIVQAGQGFMVLANNNGAEFDFASSMQTHSTGTVLLKSAVTDDPWPGLQLKVKYDDNERQTLIVYNDNMSVGLDPGYDIGLLSAGSGVEIYTTLVGKDEGVNLARQALPVSGADKTVIPVGIDTEQGGEVTFSAFTVPLGSNRFWLEDRVAGVFTDLTTKSYTVTLPAKSYGTGRFFILASTNTPTGSDDPEADDTGLRIWNAYDRIIIKGSVSDRAVCEVYDVRGQKVIETRLEDGEMNTITLPPGKHGVYLVRVTDGLKVTTHKVAVL